MRSSQIDVLEAVLRTSDTRPTADIKAALTRLSSELQQRIARGTDDSLEFVQNSVRALSRLKGCANAQVRMTCLSDGGQYLFSHGKAFDAVLAGSQFERLARTTGDNQGLSKALVLQGMANSELGNISESLVQLSQALEVAPPGNLERRAAIFINLGIALNYAGLYHDAIACFDQSLAVVGPITITSLQAAALGDEVSRATWANKAWSYFELGQLHHALKAIRKSLHQAGKPKNALFAERRATRECILVQIAVGLEDSALATEHALISHSFSHVSDRARFYGELAMGTAEAGRGTTGAERLERLLASTNSKAQRVNVLSTLARAFDRMGRADDALKCMVEMISLVRQQRQESLATMLEIRTDASFSARDNMTRLAAYEATLRAKVAERKLAKDRIEMLERLAVTADVKEEQSGRHGYRVGRLSKLIAQRLGWRANASSALESAAKLHDIGKIAVPDHLLTSSVQLRSTERQLMCMHTTAGAELLTHSDSAELRVAEEIARYHHEWWDGTGYPANLAGKRIPIHARIVALADVFDALTHGRPYSPPWSIDRALAEIRSKRGTQFDPDLTDTFLALIADLRRDHSDLDAFLGEASRNSPLLQARERIRLMLNDGSGPPAAATGRIH